MSSTRFSIFWSYYFWDFQAQFKPRSFTTIMFKLYIIRTILIYSFWICFKFLRKLNIQIFTLHKLNTRFSILAYPAVGMVNFLCTYLPSLLEKSRENCFKKFNSWDLSVSPKYEHFSTTSSGEDWSYLVWRFIFLRWYTSYAVSAYEKLLYANILSLNTAIVWEPGETVPFIIFLSFRAFPCKICSRSLSNFS